MLGKAALFAVICAMIVYYLERYLDGCEYEGSARIDGKVVVITGANTGIGKHTTIELLKKGGKVYMACRSVSRAQTAMEEILNTTGVAPEQLVFLRLDLASLASIRTFATEFKRRESRLDILINNAGVMKTTESKTEDGFEIHFGTNHLGHFLLTQLLIDHLLVAAPSRIITLSSDAHSWVTINFDNILDSEEPWPSYLQSKLANVLFSNELARRLHDTGVTSNSLHPGLVESELGRDVAFINLPVIRTVLYPFGVLFTKDAWHGAQTTLYLALDEAVHSDSGKYYSECTEVVQSAEAQDPDVALRLWDLSVQMVKLQPDEIHPLLKIRQTGVQQ